MKSDILSLFLCMGTIAFVSCNEDNKESVYTGDATLKIESRIDTRAVINGTNFAIEDRIGVYAFLGNDEEEYTKGSTNMEAMYNGNEWIFDSPLVLSRENANIYAYYPYSPKTDFTQISVDITPYTNTGQSEYLYGRSEASAENPKAYISFKHALARVTFSIKRGKEDVGNGKLTKVCLGNAVNSKAPISTRGTMDIMTGSITPVYSQNASIALPVDNTLDSSSPVNIDFLVIPTQAVAEEVELALTVDDALYVVKLPSVEWVGGQQYTYPVFIDRKVLPIK